MLNRLGSQKKGNNCSFTRQTTRTGAAKVQTKLLENETQQLKKQDMYYVISHTHIHKISQSVNQSINPSINRSINQLIHSFIHESIDQ